MFNILISKSRWSQAWI